VPANRYVTVLTLTGSLDRFEWYDYSLRLVAYTPLLFVGYKHFIDCSIAAGSVRSFLGDAEW